MIIIESHNNVPVKGEAVLPDHKKAEERRKLQEK